MGAKPKIEDIDLMSIDSAGKSRSEYGSRNHVGLKFFVYSSGRKEWHFRYMSPHDSRTSIKLGDFPCLKYDEAVEALLVQKELLANGIDPVESRRYQKRKHRQEQTQAKLIASDGYNVANFANEYVEFIYRTKKPGTSRRYAGVVKNYVVPLFGGMDVRYFYFPEYEELLMEINAPSQRSNTHKVIRALFSYLVEKEVIQANPLLGRKSLNAKLSLPPRRRYLSPSNLHKFLNELSDQSISNDARFALMLQLHLGIRIGEVTSINWVDIDFRARVIKHSNVIMKSGKPAETVMSDQVRRMLLEWKRDHADRVEKVFSVDSNHVIDQVSKHLQKWIMFTSHDLRRTVRTYLQEMGCPKEIREQITNHAQAQGVAEHYDHAKQQQAQLEWLSAWADKLEEFKLSASALKVGIEVDEDDALLAEFADLI